LFLCGILRANIASADPSLTDKSVATELFKEGRTLLDEGRVAEACRKLEESQRLDPGGGTLLNLALCHEREGRTATAWVEFTEALGLAKREERAPRIEFARTHIAQLEPDLSRMVIQVPAGADVPDLEVRRDGGIVARAAWGSPVPIDPGDHVVEASAPGRLPWRQTVVVGAKADTKTIVVPTLEIWEDPSPSATPPPARATLPDQATGPADSSRVTPVGDRSPKTPASAGAGTAVAGWSALAIGVAGTAVGTYFGIRAMSLKSDSDRDCPSDRCTAQGSSEASDAIKAGNFSTVGFAVGAAGLGLGTVLLVLSHSAPRATAVRSRTSPASLALTSGDVSARPGACQFTLSGTW
jgi:hypothetical protein